MILYSWITLIQFSRHECYSVTAGTTPKDIINNIICSDIDKQKRSLLHTTATNFHSSIKVFSSSVICTFWLSTRISFMAATPTTWVALMFPEHMVWFVELDSRSYIGVFEPILVCAWWTGCRIRHERQFLMIFSHLGSGRIGRTWYIFIISNYE